MESENSHNGGRVRLEIATSVHAYQTLLGGGSTGPLVWENAFESASHRRE